MLRGNTRDEADGRFQGVLLLILARPVVGGPPRLEPKSRSKRMQNQPTTGIFLTSYDMTSAKLTNDNAKAEQTMRCSFATCAAEYDLSTSVRIWNWNAARCQNWNANWVALWQPDRFLGSNMKQQGLKACFCAGESSWSPLKSLQECGFCWNWPKDPELCQCADCFRHVLLAASVQNWNRTQTVSGCLCLCTPVIPCVHLFPPCPNVSIYFASICTIPKRLNSCFFPTKYTHSIDIQIIISHINGQPSNLFMVEVHLKFLDLPQASPGLIFIISCFFLLFFWIFAQDWDIPWSQRVLCSTVSRRSSNCLARRRWAKALWRCWRFRPGMTRLNNGSIAIPTDID